MKRICTAMQSYSLIILYINSKASWDLHLRTIQLCVLYEKLGPGGDSGLEEAQEEQRKDNADVGV